MQIQNIRTLQKQAKELIAKKKFEQATKSLADSRDAIAASNLSALKVLPYCRIRCGLLTELLCDRVLNGMLSDVGTRLVEGIQKEFSVKYLEYYGKSLVYHKGSGMSFLGETSILEESFLVDAWAKVLKVACRMFR